MQEIDALNYLSSTLFKLRHDNNKIALQQAYDEIFNNINLKRLPSNETLNKTKALMDQLTDMLLTEKIKEEIEQKRSEAFQNTLLKHVDAETFVNIEQWLQSPAVKAGLTQIASKATGATLASTAATTAATAAAATATVSSAAILVPVAVATGSAIVVVSKVLYEDYSTYTKGIKDTDLELSKKELETFNENCKSYLDSYWQILKKTQIPDSARLTQSDFELYITALDDKNNLSRYRRLKLNEKRMQYIPEYWLKRAEAAFCLWENDPFPEYAKDIAYCRDQYQFFEGFLRIDTYKANLDRMYIQTGDLSAEEARENIDSMISIDPDDAKSRLFAAATALRYGDRISALKHLKVNFDLQQMQLASHSLLSKVMQFDDQSDPNFDRFLKAVMINTENSNQENVFYYKKYTPDNKFFAKIEPNIKNLQVAFTSSLISSSDNIEVTLDNKWFINEDLPVKATLVINNQLYQFDRVDYDEDSQTTTLTFTNVGNQDELAGKPLPVEFRLATQFFPVSIKGHFQTVETEKGRVSQFIDKAVNKLPFGNDEKKQQPTTTKLILIYQMGEICSGVECLEFRQNNI